MSDFVKRAEKEMRSRTYDYRAMYDAIKSKLGPQLADEAITELKNHRSFYVNNYPKTTNFEMSPLSYLNAPKQDYTAVPLQEWMRDNPRAYGTTSMWDGIRIPLNDRRANRIYSAGGLAGVLAHEGSHYRDLFSDFRGDFPTLSPEFEERFHKLEPSIGYTGQENDEEVMAQLLVYEAMSPAGQRVLNSKELKPLFQTMRDKVNYYRRRYPMPKGVDAMTGMPE